jgi:plastocyanin
MKIRMCVILLLIIFIVGCGDKVKTTVIDESLVEEEVEGEPLPEVPEEWEGKTIQELLDEGGAQDVVDVVVNATTNITEENVTVVPVEDVPAGTHLVDIQLMGETFQFFPKTLTISKGDTVRWTNHLNYLNKNARVAVFARHNSLFRSSQLSYGDYFEYTFNETGSYLYSTVPYTADFKNGEVIVT